jgi:hypothetical protein
MNTEICIANDSRYWYRLKYFTKVLPATHTQLSQAFMQKPKLRCKFGSLMVSPQQENMLRKNNFQSK